MTRRVAIQGEPGSFHHTAARQLLGDDIVLVGADRFRRVFEAVADGAADCAVVACENSLYGSIHEVYDLLLEYRFPITAEHIEHIHQNLIAQPGVELAEIREIYSHPVALDQCRDWLAANVPQAEIIEHADTAGAVHDIAQQPSPFMAAIAGAEAARLYELPILAANIEDEATNLTRFLLLDPHATPRTDTTRASLVLTTPHTSGALHAALGVFAAHGINLTKLESRPIRGQAFDYQFFIDLDIAGQLVEPVTAELESLGCTVTLLGQY